MLEAVGSKSMQKQTRISSRPLYLTVWQETPVLVTTFCQLSHLKDDVSPQVPVIFIRMRTLYVPSEAREIANKTIYVGI